MFIHFFNAAVTFNMKREKPFLKMFDAFAVGKNVQFFHCHLFYILQSNGSIWSPVSFQLASFSNQGQTIEIFP